MANNNNNNKSKTGGFSTIKNKIEMASPLTTEGNNTMEQAKTNQIKFLTAEARAYLTRLQENEEKGINQGNADEKQIGFRLRMIQAIGGTKAANDVVVKLGLEKYGWRQVDEKQYELK